MDEQHKQHDMEKQTTDNDSSSLHQRSPVDEPSLPVSEPHKDLSMHNMPSDEHAHMDHNEHNGSNAPAAEHAGHGKAHTDHSGHEQMFRKKFWVSLVLSVPVLLFSPTIQTWLGYRCDILLGTGYPD
jgi:Cu2+-exporting ATPase